MAEIVNPKHTFSELHVLMSLTFVYHGEKRQPVQHIVHLKEPAHQITVRSAAALSAALSCILSTGHVNQMVTERATLEIVTAGCKPAHFPFACFSSADVIKSLSPLSDK